ncbi:MAG: SpoIVB peptidase [Limnochordales bacterium]|nr:SpoIVB peptidase [Limnochordales bacterium]
MSGGRLGRLLLAFLVLTSFAGSVVGWSVWQYPASLRLFPDEPLPIASAFPLSVSASPVAGQNTSLPASYQLDIRVGRWTLRTVDLEVVAPKSVIPGGDAIGVLLAPRGLIISRHQPLTGADGKEYYPAKEAGIEVGDVLVEIESRPVETPADVSLLVDAYGARGEDLDITLMRNGTLIRTRIRPVAVQTPRPDGSTRITYLLGLLLQEPVAGVGTLSFIDPETGIYGALGHMVVSNNGSPLPMVAGRIVSAYITGIQPGWRGLPGEKIGVFDDRQNLLGSIEKNTRFGIFGHLYPSASAAIAARKVAYSGSASGSSSKIPVALAREVKPGPAHILTVLHGREIEAFSVQIEKVTRQSRPDDKGLVVRVTDPRLLQQTGGIVQGMSGSPIIQNDKLVGVITHVFVNDQTRGYGILAEWMMAEAGLWRSDSGRSEEQNSLPEDERLPAA